MTGFKQVRWLPEEFSELPDGGLERNVAHEDLGARLLFVGLLFLA